MNEHLRISDADRDRAAARLAEHYAEGRITTDEHAERLDAIWTARTGADLRPIFEDLPLPAAPQPVRRDHRPAPRRVPFWPAAAVLVMLSVITDLPFWILIFAVGCGLFSRRRHSWR